MKFSINLKTEANYNKLYIYIAGNKYIIYPDEKITIDVPDNEVMLIKVFSKTQEKISILQHLIKFPLRIVRGLFDIILMNLPTNFVKTIEPYNFCYSFEVNLSQLNEITISYTPSNCIDEGEVITLPLLKIDDKNIDLDCRIDADSANEAFCEYCAHFISISFYSFLLFAMIFILSCKSTFWPLLLSLVLITVLIPVVKLNIEYKRMKKIKRNITHRFPS